MIIILFCVLSTQGGCRRVISRIFITLSFRSDGQCQRVLELLSRRCSKLCMWRRCWSLNCTVVTIRYVPPVFDEKYFRWKYEKKTLCQRMFDGQKKKKKRRETFKNIYIYNSYKISYQFFFRSLNVFVNNNLVSSISYGFFFFFDIHFFLSFSVQLSFTTVIYPSLFTALLSKIFVRRRVWPSLQFRRFRAIHVEHLHRV